MHSCVFICQNLSSPLCYFYDLCRSSTREGVDLQSLWNDIRNFQKKIESMMSSSNDTIKYVYHFLQTLVFTSFLFLVLFVCLFVRSSLTKSMASLTVSFVDLFVLNSLVQVSDLKIYGNDHSGVVHSPSGIQVFTSFLLCMGGWCF